MITGGAWNFHDLNLSWFEHSFYAYIFKAYITRSKQAKKKKGTYSAQLHKSKKSTIGHKLRKTKNSKNTRGSIDEKRKDFGDGNRKDRALNIHTEGQSEQADTHGPN